MASSFIALMLGDLGTPRIDSRTVAGRTVMRVRDAAMPGTYPRHVYVDGDTIWLIASDEPLRTAIVASLP